MILGLVVFQIIVHELWSKDGHKNCPYAWTLELSSRKTCTLCSLSGLVLPTGNEQYGNISAGKIKFGKLAIDWTIRCPEFGKVRFSKHASKTILLVMMYFEWAHWCTEEFMILFQQKIFVNGPDLDNQIVLKDNCSVHHQDLFLTNFAL